MGFDAVDIVSEAMLMARRASLIHEWVCPKCAVPRARMYSSLEANLRQSPARYPFTLAQLSHIGVRVPLRRCHASDGGTARSWLCCLVHEQDPSTAADSPCKRQLRCLQTIRLAGDHVGERARPCSHHLFTTGWPAISLSNHLPRHI